MAGPTIAVVGGTNMDLAFKLPAMPGPGDSANCDSLKFYPGGKGANMAVAAYRAAHDHGHGSRVAKVRVCLNSAVGTDAFGRTLLDGLQRNGVDVSTVDIIDNTPSGTCVVVVETATEEAESRNFGHQGANSAWTFSQTDTLSRLVKGAPELPLAEPDLVLVQLTDSLDTMRNILVRARDEGVDTILNAALIGPEHKIDFWESITHLILNKIETARLLGLDAQELRDTNGLRRAASMFLERGVKHAIITLGGDGAYFATSSGEHGHVAAEKDVEVVDTTGAGDTFVGNYAIEYLQQKRRGVSFDIQTAIELACHAAARTIERVGAQEAIPWRDQRVRRG